jgi:UDP-GlcNAc:undecaprenyl-phosphate/decaprenyl-phosphate GlcNAc-1-phosphate transferase
MISDASLFFAVVFAALSAATIGIFADRIGQVSGLLDVPGGRKHHRKSTPLMGGLALLVGLLPILAAYMLTYEPVGIGHWALGSFAITMSGCAVLGMADDRFALSARPRFALTFLMFGMLLIVEPRFGLFLLHFQSLSDPVVLGKVGGWIFTVLVLLGFLNAVNMADGKNGLVIGLSIIWSLLIVALRLQHARRALSRRRRHLRPFGFGRACGDLQL